MSQTMKSIASYLFFALFILLFSTVILAEQDSQVCFAVPTSQTYEIEDVQPGDVEVVQGTPLVEDFIAYSTEETEVCGCTSFSDTISFENTGNTVSSYLLTIAGSASPYVQLMPGQFVLEPGQKSEVAEMVRMPCAPEGVYSLDTVISTSLGLEKVLSQQFVVKRCNSISLDVVVEEQLVCEGEVATFQLLLENTAPYQEEYSISFDSSLSKKISVSENPVLLRPGESKIVYIYVNSANVLGSYDIPLSLSTKNSGFGAQEVLHLKSGICEGQVPAMVAPVTKTPPPPSVKAPPAVSKPVQKKITRSLTSSEKQLLFILLLVALLLLFLFIFAILFVLVIRKRRQHVPVEPYYDQIKDEYEQVPVAPIVVPASKPVVVEKKEEKKWIPFSAQEYEEEMEEHVEYTTTEETIKEESSPFFVEDSGMRSIWMRVIILILLLITIGGLLWYFYSPAEGSNDGGVSVVEGTTTSAFSSWWATAQEFLFAYLWYIVIALLLLLFLFGYLKWKEGTSEDVTFPDVKIGTKKESKIEVKKDIKKEIKKETKKEILEPAQESMFLKHLSAHAKKHWWKYLLGLGLIVVILLWAFMWGIGSICLVQVYLPYSIVAIIVLAFILLVIHSRQQHEDDDYIRYTETKKKKQEIKEKSYPVLFWVFLGLLAALLVVVGGSAVYCSTFGGSYEAPLYNNSENTNSELLQRLDELQNQLRESNTTPLYEKINSVENALREIQAEVNQSKDPAELQSRIDELERLLKELSDKSDASASRQDDLTSAIRELQDSIEAALQDVSSRQKEDTATLRAELDDLQKTLSDIELNFDDLNIQQNDDVTAMLQDLQQSLQKVLSQLDDKTDTRVILSEIDALRDRMEELFSKLDSMKAREPEDVFSDKGVIDSDVFTDEDLASRVLSNIYFSARAGWQPKDHPSGIVVYIDANGLTVGNSSVSGEYFNNVNTGIDVKGKHGRELLAQLFNATLPLVPQKTPGTIISTIKPVETVAPNETPEIAPTATPVESAAPEETPEIVPTETSVETAASTPEILPELTTTPELTANDLLARIGQEGLNNTFAYQVLQQNSYKEINLSQYFVDPDGDALTFTSTSPDHVRVDIWRDLAVLRPEPGFLGLDNVTFFAEDTSGERVNSSVMTIIVVEPEKQPSFLAVYQYYILVGVFVLLVFIVLALFTREKRK